MNKKLIGYAAAIFAALGAANAQADSIGLTAITVNGDKMVNDSVLDVTWADILPSKYLDWPSAYAWVAYPYPNLEQRDETQLTVQPTHSEQFPY